MIHQSTYTETEAARLPRPLASFFEVDDRIREESARIHQGVPIRAEGNRGVGAAMTLLAADAVALVASVSASGPFFGQAGGWLPRWTPVFVLLWLGAMALGRIYPGWGIGPVTTVRNRSLSAFAAMVLTGLALLAGNSPQVADVMRVVASAGIGVGATVLARGLVRRAFLRRGRWGVSTVFYGTTDSARRVLQVLQTQPDVGFRPIGVFEDDPRMWGRELAGVPVLGDTGLVHPDAPVAMVAGLGGASAHSRMDALLKYYRQVIIVPDLVDQNTAIMQPVDLGGLLGLQLQINLASPLARGLKRTVELALTLLTLPAWGAVVAAGALAVWLGDRKNPFYAQARVGRGGRVIHVHKLRTMVPDAESVLQAALREDEALRIEWETTAKLQDDPRITRVGAVLRRLSVDELPQLFNVLKGEMALVGPRPLPSYHEDRLAPDARELRRRVRPGVTGLWQVSGRSNTGDAGIAWLDAYYVRNWSAWLDLTVFLRTFSAALRGEGAY